MTKEKAGKIDLSLITDRILHSSAPVPLISCMYACMHAWIEVKSVLISISNPFPFLYCFLFPQFPTQELPYHTTTSQFYILPSFFSFISTIFFLFLSLNLNLRFITRSNIFFLSISFHISVITWLLCIQPDLTWSFSVSILLCDASFHI